MYDNKNKLIGILIVIAVIFSFFTIYVYSADSPTVSARAATLFEPETESFVYMKNADERLPMASTTKILTGLIALDTLPEDELITVDERAVGIEGSSIYLEAGETLTAKDLVYALILQSANDAAAALAIKISGTVDSFAELMNEKARELGLHDSSFKNPHGLDAEGHYTTAHDLAIISAAALKNESFKEICSTYKKEITSSEKTRLVVNHNKLLKSYDGCIGMKTGYTKRSGRSLVSAAERDGVTMIAVTIDAPDDWRDHTKLLDLGFSLFEARYLARSGEFSYELPVLDGVCESVRVKNTEDFKIVSEISKAGFKTHVKLSRYLVAPINEGDEVGKVIFTKDGKLIGEITLRADKTVEKKAKKGLFSIFDKG